jgi:hypothetical protein
MNVTYGEGFAPAEKTMLEKVFVLEDKINELPQVDCPVRHYFAGGIYAREMTIPAGVVLTGAVHRHEHLCTVSQGRLMVSTDEGMKTVSAPYTIISKPGTKRVGYALETTVWTTYHLVGDETDLDKIMFEITESTNSQLIGGRDNVQLKNNLRLADQEDYQKFLDEYGFNEALVRQLVDNTDDRTEFPDEPLLVRFAPSDLHGTGTFACVDIPLGGKVVDIRIGDKRTPAGWLINHSCKANIVFTSSKDGGLVALAIKDIQSGDEITVDYRQAMSVNGAGFSPRERITK